MKGGGGVCGGVGGGGGGGGGWKVYGYADHNVTSFDTRTLNFTIYRH